MGNLNYGTIIELSVKLKDENNKQYGVREIIEAKPRQLEMHRQTVK